MSCSQPYRVNQPLQPSARVMTIPGTTNQYLFGAHVSLSLEIIRYQSWSRMQNSLHHGLVSKSSDCNGPFLCKLSLHVLLVIVRKIEHVAQCEDKHERTICPLFLKALPWKRAGQDGGSSDLSTPALMSRRLCHRGCTISG